jgi:hypothetical protein
VAETGTTNFISRNRSIIGTIKSPEPKPVNPLIKKAARTMILDKIITVKSGILFFLPVR